MTDLTKDIQHLRERLRLMEDKAMNTDLSALVAKIVEAVGNLDVAQRAPSSARRINP